MNEMGKPMRDLVARFIEETGADAVVVACSTVKRNETKTYFGVFGNILACRGLVDELYTEVVEDSGEAVEDENE
tara:strand:- start:313 stop:534 length:222 start_codon:yes stop_codon:yes gene_type:complete